METKTHIREQDPFRFLKRWPWEKITIWAAFLFLIYLLRSFFGVIFLTFVLSYIASNVVLWASRKMKIADRPNHPLRYLNTLAVFLVFLCILGGAGWLVLPRLVEQGRRLAQQAQELIPRKAARLMTPEDRADKIMKEVLGEERYQSFRDSPRYYPIRAQLAEAMRKIPGRPVETLETCPEEAVVKRIDRREKEDTALAGPRPARRKDLLDHLDSLLRAVMGRKRFEEFRDTPTYEQTYGQVVNSLQTTATENLPALADILTTVATRLFTYAMHFLMAIIFSFLIVMGIPTFGKKISSLAESRIGGFYQEIAPSVVSFGRSMGMAFQGQAIIALVNTALTMIGLVLLGIPYPIALGVIVFLCSFVPVLGVFISSAPIVLVCLQECGVLLAFEAVALITLIHLIEAYVLNPRILGSVMHMNPLLILVILFIGEHFFGVWGLLIGVPLCHYLFNHVILKKPFPERRRRKTGEIAILPDSQADEGDSPHEDAAKEGENAPAPPKGEAPPADPKRREP